MGGGSRDDGNGPTARLRESARGRDEFPIASRASPVGEAHHARHVATQNFGATSVKPC